MDSLSERVVVISGATSAIGRALCRAFVDDGGTIYLLGRNVDRLHALADEMARPNLDVSVAVTDLCSVTSIEELAATIGKRESRVDLLIHAAGEFATGPIATADVTEFDKLFQANVRGAYLLVQALLPLVRRPPGQIVFLNSTVGLHGKEATSAYAATQHGLRAIADSLRAEENRNGIRVVSLYLGRVATERQERIFAQEGREYQPELLLQPDDVAAMVVAAVQLPRTAEVTEIRMRPLVKSY
ncbi:MAG: SDR family NAD(P)-dependent oxidoreductase [Pseudomonadota bacterium]